MAKKYFFLNICLPALLAACLLSACGKELPETPVQTLPVSTEETAASATESASETETVTTPEAPAQDTQPSLQPSEEGTEAPSSSAETAPETTEPVDPETAKKEAEERLFRFVEDADGRIFYTHAGFGHPIKGFREIDGKTYYFSEKDGAMATGFVDIGGKTYCFDVKGVMLKNTKVSGYSIDENGVCTMDFSGRFTLTEYNLNAYCDYLLQKNGRSLEAIYNFVWKNFRQHPNEPIGNLFNPTAHEVNQMIIRFFNDGGGACCDYSYATQRLLERAGYKNVIVHCDPMQSRHQWNLVEIEPGVWRHMDTFRKAYRIFLMTDDEIAAYDTNDVPYRWDRSRWTSTTSSGTGGSNPVKPTEPAETTAPETEAPTEAPTRAPEPSTEATEEPTEPPTTEAPPTETAAEPSTEAPTQPSSEAPTEAPTEAPEPRTEATEAPTEPPTTEAPPTESAPEETTEPNEDILLPELP